MASSYEVRFKLNSDEYVFFEGLAKFFYDNRVIHGPSVHSLAKLAMIKIGNEWIQIQSAALERRKQRQQRINSLT